MVIQNTKTTKKFGQKYAVIGLKLLEINKKKDDIKYQDKGESFSAEKDDKKTMT